MYCITYFSAQYNTHIHNFYYFWFLFLAVHISILWSTSDHSSKISEIKAFGESFYNSDAFSAA